ncbi:hypothetical protein LINPERHAP2_LOCUS3221, partial [Linum perenne]
GLGAGLLGGRPCELRRSCLGQVSRVGCRSTEWHWGSLDGSYHSPLLALDLSPNPSRGFF